MRLGVLIVGVVTAVAARAQGGAAGFFNPLSASRDGIHLYNASVYTGYFSGGIPFEVSTVQNLAAPRGTAVVGGSADLGWSRTREGTSLVLAESVSYMVYPEGIVMPNTTGTLGWNGKIGQKWSISMSGTAKMVDLRQSYFAMNSLGLAASLPTTFDGLSAAMLKGSFTDSQLASALTGASVSLLPEQAYLYGQHVGSVTALLGASYTPSGRTTFKLGATASRTQELNVGDKSKETVQALVPKTTSVGVSVGWAYALSPRTQIGVDGETSRIVSRFQDGYTSTARFSAGRTMSEHWLLRGSVGIGLLTYLRQVVTTPSAAQYTLGGSLGYKLRAHTLLCSFNRFVGDTYGVGASSTNAATAGWSWKAPGGSWSASVNYNYQQLNGSLTRRNESWRVSGGIARALSPHVFVSAQYVYFKLPPTLLLLGSELLDKQTGVTMNVFWSPSQYR